MYGTIQSYIQVNIFIFAPCNIARYILPPIPDAVYDIRSGLNTTLATLVWTHTGKYSVCGDINYTLREFGTNLPLPSTIKLSGTNQIFVNANNYLQTGVYLVEVVG